MICAPQPFPGEGQHAVPMSSRPPTRLPARIRLSGLSAPPSSTGRGRVHRLGLPLRCHHARPKNPSHTAPHLFHARPTHPSHTAPHSQASRTRSWPCMPRRPKPRRGAAWSSCGRWGRRGERGGMGQEGGGGRGTVWGKRGTDGAKKAARGVRQLAGAWLAKFTWRP